MIETTEKELFKALTIYKERFGSIGKTDTDKLELIIKEIQSGSKS